MTREEIMRDLKDIRYYHSRERIMRDVVAEYQRLIMEQGAQRR